MELEFIRAGQIVNTHGVRGEVKLLPGGVPLEILERCRTFYLNGRPLSPSARRTHKGCLLLTLPGVADMNAALELKGRELFIRKADAQLPEGFFFDEELVGLTARNAETGDFLGRLEEVLDYPAHKVYVVRGGPDEYLVPAVPAFVAGVNLAEGTIDIHLWEGLGSHED